MKDLIISQKITVRNNSNLALYLSEINKYKLLNIDEELELFYKIKEGDKRALNTLINSNLRFVVSVAKNYSTKKTSLLDIINTGNIGLHKAAERFDHTKGFKFISYAVWWIRQEIILADINTQFIRVPSNRVTLKNKILTFINNYYTKNLFYPSEKEIEKELDIKKGYSFINNEEVWSLDRPLDPTNDSSTFGDRITTKELSIDEDLKEDSLKYVINNYLTFLNKTQRAVIEYTYGINKPILLRTEVAKKLNLTYERVRQLETVALTNLTRKAKNNNKYLSDYL